MLLTQVEIEGGRFHAEQVSLGDILAKSAKRAGRLAVARRVGIEIPHGEIGWTIGERELLTRAWTALLETAVKVSTAGEAVQVKVCELDDVVVLALDTQSGIIPPAVLPGFFLPFTMSEASTCAGSLGLDPAMARRILSLWSSSVTAENLTPSGVRFTVRCPRAAKSQSVAAIEVSGG
ncbi:MAG: hypothetical protein WDO73_15995 [Ignavibacteriota bacterium]